MKIDIVIYLMGIGRWATFHRRAMIEALARNAEGTARIVCINQPVSPLLDAVFYRERFSRWLRAARFCQVSRNLYVFSPIAWVHRRVTHRTGARKIYDQMLSWQIRRTLTGLKFSQTRRIGWLYRPEQVAYLGWGHETYTVYECYDEYRDQFDGNARDQVVRNEQLLLDNADMVFTTSRSLYRSRSALHPSVHYIPNGVDYDLFAAARSAATREAEDLGGISEPRIGYVGNISSQLDIRLLLHVAQTHPEWSIVLIGPLDRSLSPRERGMQSTLFATLSRLENVHLLGIRPYRDLPSYLKGMNVTLIPYSLSAYAHNRNPLKLWEYLAAGKVVVSTALHQLLEFSDTVNVGRTPDEFVSLLERTLTSDNSMRIARGTALAAQHSWTVLTQRMLEILLGAMR